MTGTCEAGAEPEPPGVKQAFLQAQACCAAERHQSVIDGWARVYGGPRHEIPVRNPVTEPATSNIEPEPENMTSRHLHLALIP